MSRINKKIMEDMLIREDANRAAFNKELADLSAPMLMAGRKVKFTYFAAYGFNEYEGTIDSIVGGDYKELYVIIIDVKGFNMPLMVESKFIFEVSG